MAKPKSRDQEIDDLLEEVNKRKNAINKAKVKYAWETNCMFSWTEDSMNRINIQTINSVELLVKMAAHVIQKEANFKTASILFGVKAKFEYGGFTKEQWLADIDFKIKKLDLSVNEKKLKELEDILDTLVSKERREEMLLDKVKKALS